MWLSTVWNGTRAAKYNPKQSYRALYSSIWPSTAQYGPVQASVVAQYISVWPSTMLYRCVWCCKSYMAKHSPVETFTVPHGPVHPRMAQGSQVQPHTAQYGPVQSCTVLYSSMWPSTALYIAVESCRVLQSSIAHCSPRLPCIDLYGSI